MLHDYEDDFGRPPRDRDLRPDEMLRVIFDYVGRIAREQQLERLVTVMADMGKDIVVADRCTVWLVDESSQELWTMVAHGVDELRIPLGSGLVGYAVARGEPVVINDAYADRRFDQEVDRQTGYHTRNIIALPIRNSEGEIIGVYQAINKMTRGGQFTDTDVQHLLLAATYTGNALESAMLHQEIEATQKEIIYTLAEAGESRSKETGNHVKRVAEYSRILALGYGLGAEEAELVKMASPMHDIGKIGIPDAILLKPGKLDRDEFEIMKTHAALGFEMFKHSKRPILRAAAVIAHEHHEKWNGKGYPRGLGRQDIHTYGRITAVADVFDALGSERVYKKAWPLERILDLFREERGQHFDPDLVDVFFDRLGEFIKVRDRLRDVLPDEVTKSAVS